ncbi:hypothetical protein HMPREF1981_01422 [Bacteroides pyogenes F0041]|uniref:Uncharacterized protein n=1 Tax=Bacteroides pyogenes F0041 TaxID=1321819 RepID=U2CMG6_9BACE|nr:hypothetical protein HMPREF1981_01422 [Bacteroides pyogenes F0041]GAE21475.1 hypothetical protein JCM10003_933 [Bacteroides pyogenes JCM 10003]
MNLSGSHSNDIHQRQKHSRNLFKHRNKETEIKIKSGLENKQSRIFSQKPPLEESTFQTNLLNTKDFAWYQ